MRLWPNPSLAPDYDYLGPDGEVIEVYPSLKDLGVHLSSDLSFKLQVEKVVSASCKMAGWGLRTFRRRSLGTMKQIWKTLVQPQMDYCSQQLTWSPGDQESINRLESVQRHFLSQVSGDEVSSLDHWARLKQFKIYSQEPRRERYMVIFLWKISQGIVKGYSVIVSVIGRRSRTTLPRDVVQSSPSLVRKARESSIGVKGARLFNLLPAHIRKIDANNVETFKKSLDSFLTDIPDQPTIAGQGRTGESNSLLHQIPLFMLNN
jgi:hypothetical protein